MDAALRALDRASHCCFHDCVSSRRLWMLLVAIAAWPACDEESALARLGEGCTLSSDCDGGLACVFGVCHRPCNSSKDCAGGSCVMGPDRVMVCEQQEMTGCDFASECPVPLVCGIDGRCRNECQGDRDCVPGQVCVTATCADPAELDDGRLTPEPDANPLGKPCFYSSDCLPGGGGLVLECKHGRCAYACFEERDCPRFHRCSTADEPAAPGNCELIGESGKLYCDPDEDPAGGFPCPCVDGARGAQSCLPDGSGLGVCSCN
jgi:hypothetical protein